MMESLIDSNGAYRIKEAGVSRGDDIVHVTPPAHLVPSQMNDLFNWLSNTDLHPLIKSSIFHYEFEFIYPFADGNGRMGRLWQTVILSEWNDVFIDIPIESMIFARQEEYYDAINKSTEKADCAYFIHFMLKTSSPPKLRSSYQFLIQR